MSGARNWLISQWLSGPLRGESRLTFAQREMIAGKAVVLTVSRNGSVENIELTPTEVCAYPVVVGNTDDVNAYADGQKVVIAKGMMRFVENDDELALVIAHSACAAYVLIDPPEKTAA